MAGDGPTIRESIKGAIAEHSAVAAPAASASPSPAPSPSPTDSPAPSPSAPVESPPRPNTLKGKDVPTTGNDAGSPVKGAARAADGKFQAKPADAPPEPSVKAEPKSPDPVVEPKDDGALPPILAPNGWGKDVKADWSKLPRPVQTEIEKREKDRDRALHQERSKIQTALRDIDATRQAIAPYERYLAINGGPSVALPQLLALGQSAAENPAGFVQWFAKQHRIDLASLVAGPQSQAPEDPTVKALQDQLARQGRVIQELGNRFQTTTQSADQRAQQEMASTIDRWSQEKDASGNLKRPYFERLENDVIDLMPTVKREMPQASPLERLEAAYERAVYANPETRAALSEQAESKRRAEAQAKAAQAVQQAKAAGGGISGGTAPNAGSVPPKTIGEGLRRALAEQRARAA